MTPVYANHRPEGGRAIASRRPLSLPPVDNDIDYITDCRGNRYLSAESVSFLTAAFEHRAAKRYAEMGIPRGSFKTTDHLRKQPQEH